MKVYVSSETGRLKSVIVGYPDNFLQVEPEIINETMRHFYSGAHRPRRETVIAQLGGLIAVLKSYGVEVVQPLPLAHVPDQLMARDIGVTIGDTFLVTTMAAKSRQHEWRGIAWLFSRFSPQTDIVFAPEEFVVEGGDIVVDQGKIFIGIGQRSTVAGAEYLAGLFPQFEVVPVELKGLTEGEDVLHLDCSFVPVGDRFALIYPDGMREIPAAIAENYELIEATREEQQSLGTNVLSISTQDVIARPSSERLNHLLRERGLNVIEVPFSDPPKTGGSFRCCTLPLLRE